MSSLHPLDYEPLNTARRQLTLWSSILILWFAIGVDADKVGLLSGLKRPEWIPILVAIIVVYQAYRWLLCWTRTASEDRTHWTVRVDAVIPLELARIGLTLLATIPAGVVVGPDGLVQPLLESLSEPLAWFGAALMYLVPSFLGLALGLSQPQSHIRSRVLIPLSVLVGAIAVISGLGWISMGGDYPPAVATTVTMVLPIVFWPILLRQLGLDVEALATSSSGDNKRAG